MNSSQPLNPQEICENLLLEGKRYNNERSILPSENAIADRLLARGNELQDAYEELHCQLHARPQALQILLGLVLSTAAFWNPVRIQDSLALNLNAQFDFNAVGPDGIDHGGYEIRKHGRPHEGE